MALTKVTPSMIEGSVGTGSGALVSIRDYGAIGSGNSVAEDTAAFLAAAEAGVRNIYIPKGIYKLNQTIEFDYQVRLIGDGSEGGSIIQSFLDGPTVDTTRAVFKFTGTVMQVEGLSFYPQEGIDKIIYSTCSTSNTVIDVLYDGQYNTNGGQAVVHFESVNNVIVERCTFLNGWRETQYDSSTGYEDVGNNAGNVIDIFGGANNVKINDNLFQSVWSAVKASNCNELYITNNVVRTTADTVFFDRCTAGVTRNKFINYNVIKDAGKGAIKILDSNNLTAKGHNGEVIGNIIENYGVRLATAAIFSKNNYDFPSGPYIEATDDSDRAFNLVISDNTVTQSSLYNSFPIDVFNLKNVTITGNNITYDWVETVNPDTYGFLMTTSCEDVLVSNNNIKSATKLIFTYSTNLNLTNNNIKFTNNGGIRFDRGIKNVNVTNNYIESAYNTAGFAVSGWYLGSHEPTSPSLDTLIFKNNVVTTGLASDAQYFDYLTNFIAGGLTPTGSADWPNALRSVIVEDNIVKYSDGQKVVGDRTLGRITNVKEVGAVGDGVVDDTDALQFAFDAGGQVYIPEGEYLVTRTLTVPSGIKVYGDGARVSIIKEGGQAQNFESSIIENKNYNNAIGNNDITFEEIGVVGKNIVPIIDDPAHPGDNPNDPPASANNRGLGCIGLRYVTSSNIRNCYFAHGNFGAGFVQGVRTGFTSNFDNMIENCISFNMQSYSATGNSGHPRGFLVGCDDTRIIGCSSDQCSTGFYVSANNITMDRCKAYNWTKDNGFYILLTDSTVSNCVAKGNVTGSGFAIAYTKRVSISNCRAENCGNMGFRLHAPQRDTNLTNCITTECGYGYRAENTVPWTGSNLDSVEAVYTSPTSTKLYITINLDEDASGFEEKDYVSISGANEDVVNGIFIIDGITETNGVTELVVDCEALTSSFTATGNIEVRRVCSDLQINNCIADKSTLDGMQFDISADVILNNVTITDTGRHGFAATSSRNIAITNLKATNIGEHGIIFHNVRLAAVSNSTFRDTYYSAIHSTQCEAITISNIVMDRAANHPPQASFKGVVSFFQVKGIYVNNVTGRSVRSFWVTRLTDTPDTVSYGVVRDCQRTDLSERPAGFRTINQVGENVILHESGTGDPSGVVEAAKGSTYTRTDGAGNTTFYVKETDYTNNSWTAK